jgi:serine phosphatase RsbU (regulator of sigma subunit)
VLNFDSSGPLGRAYAAVDWDRSPLGPVSSWSDTLLGVVDVMMSTRFPITLLWGPEFVLVYNDAYVPLIADKHPEALGRPAREVFPEAWDVIGPMMRAARTGRGPTWVEDEYVPLHRRGFLEECYFTFSYSPVHGPGGRVEGVMDIATETTEQVISRRRMRMLRRLTERLADVEHLEDVPRDALPLLRAGSRDFPEVHIRVRTVPDGRRDDVLPEVVETNAGGRVARFPLSSPDSPDRSYLEISLSPMLAPDDQYLGFLRLVAAALRQALDRVRARTAERSRTEAQRSMSEAFQRSLLPEPRGFGRPEVAVRYQAAAQLTQIGGDWYDLFELPDGTLTVVIGDVAGHDQKAAAAMAQVRNITRGVAYTVHPDSPSRVLQGLDRAVRVSAPDIVATVVLAQVTGRDTGELFVTWSNAGHPPPVLIRPDGSTELLEATADLLLGLDDTVPRTDHRLALSDGATIVFYTDGLVERRSLPLSEGLSWLLEVLRNQQHLSVEDLSDRLLGQAHAVEDDVALLVLRA